MKNIDGFWWPDGDRDAHRLIPGMLAGSLPMVLSIVKRREFVLQAGGNAGFYPLSLAAHFGHVLTYEPDAANFECLVRNRADRDVRNVVARNKALGEADQTVGLSRVDGNSGTGFVSGPGDVAMETIDSLHLLRCDLLWLDVNGYELQVLAGADFMLARLKPVVVIAETSTSDGAARSFLKDRGYRIAATVPARDYIMVPS